VPAIFFIGEKDKDYRVRNITDLFVKRRAEGALWCLAVEKNAGHGTGNTLDLALPFLRDAFALRMTQNNPSDKLPSPADKLPRPVEKQPTLTGLRATLETMPADKLPPKTPLASTVWLPSPAAAKAWSDFSRENETQKK
jgi:hypothetical protein